MKSQIKSLLLSRRQSNYLAHLFLPQQRFILHLAYSNHHRIALHCILETHNISIQLDHHSIHISNICIRSISQISYIAQETRGNPSIKTMIHPHRECLVHSPADNSTNSLADVPTQGLPSQSPSISHVMSYFLSVPRVVNLFIPLLTFYPQQSHLILFFGSQINTSILPFVYFHLGRRLIR